MTYVQEARVRLERASEALTSDVASHDIVRAVLAGFRTLRTTHTADDVRRAIVKALGKWAAVTLRDGGGIYWVPSVYAAELRRFQGAVEKIGTSRVHVLPGQESQNANRALGARLPKAGRSLPRWMRSPASRRRPAPYRGPSLSGWR